MVQFSDNGNPTQYRDPQGSVTDQMNFKITVNGDEKLWTMTKAKTANSVYGQFVLLGKYHGNWEGKEITLLVKFDQQNNKREYTVQEALTLIDEWNTQNKTGKAKIVNSGDKGLSIDDVFSSRKEAWGSYQKVHNTLTADLILVVGDPKLPDFGLQHLVMVGPAKISIEMIYDLDRDNDEEIGEISLYKNNKVNTPGIVLKNRRDDGKLTKDGELCIGGQLQGSKGLVPETRILYRLSNHGPTVHSVGNTDI